MSQIATYTSNSSSVALTDIESLSQRQLPANWLQAVSSPNAFVAYSQSTPAIFYKEFLPRNRWERIKSLVRGSRCQRANKMAVALTAHKFHTPKVVATGKLPLGREFMLTEAVKGQGIGYYLAAIRHHKSAATIAAKQQLTKALGKEIGRLHRAGFIHGDLRPNNILVDGSNQPPRFFFIDNERTSHSTRPLAQQLIIKNLRQIGMLFPIDISKTDRLRFFKAYLSEFNQLGTLRQSLPLAQDIFTHTINRLENTPHYHPQPAPEEE